MSLLYSHVAGLIKLAAWPLNFRVEEQFFISTLAEYPYLFVLFF